ncbi:MAG TPA: RNA polymerase sigma factor [Gemmatimonadaceae bacterium]|nr:RNA polymerase sigma factor [Gemmatimonadaceae bacterium]
MHQRCIAADMAAPTAARHHHHCPCDHPPHSRGLLIVELDDDAELVRRVIAGDTAAYAGLVARYRPRLARYAAHMLGNRADGEEALQDAFVRAFRAIHQCDDPSRFGAWLFRILVNRCRTAGERRDRRERWVVTDDRALHSAVYEPPDELTGWRGEILWALGRLEPEQREAFLLKHVEDRGYAEMAELTGAGISALKMRVKRACEHLRELLEEEYSGEQHGG